MSGTDWLIKIETRLECCEGEHYGCAEWGATDVRRLIDELKGLRKAARDYLGTLREQQHEALGDGFEEFITELEQSTTGTQRCAEALKRLDQLSKGQ